MNLEDFLLKKGRSAAGKAADWLSFCTLDVSTGALWAGDPHLANADDGYVAKVPRGRYVIEAIGLSKGRQRVVSQLRVRLESAESPRVGREVGHTGKDSGMIGVCDIKAFDGACGPDAADEVRGRRVGIELRFLGETDSNTDTHQPTSLLGLDREGFITRTMADGKEASFWLGGELKAHQRFYIWSSATTGVVSYRVRQADGATTRDWTPMKKNQKHLADEKLGPGSYEIDFRIGEEMYSALKLTLEE